MKHNIIMLTLLLSFICSNAQTTTTYDDPNGQPIGKAKTEPTYTQQPYQGSQYVPTVNLNLVGKGMAYKQAQTDQSRQNIQDALQSVANDIDRLFKGHQQEHDKMATQVKVTVDDINDTYSGQDITEPTIYNAIMQKVNALKQKVNEAYLQMGSSQEQTSTEGWSNNEWSKKYHGQHFDAYDYIRIAEMVGWAPSEDGTFADNIRKYNSDMKPMALFEKTVLKSTPDVLRQRDIDGWANCSKSHDFLFERYNRFYKAVLKDTWDTYCPVLCNLMNMDGH